MKKIGIISLVLGLIFSCLMLVVTKIEYDSYKKNVNAYVYTMIDLLNEKYSSITEQEIMTILNNDKKTNYKEVFKKYGIKEDDSVLISLKNSYENHLRLNLGFMLISLVVLSGLFLRYYLRREKKLKEITNYMQEINRKNYYLDIENNTEGELSILRNEVYKTTIMLREESKNLKQEKMMLKDTISDISHQLKTPLTSILIMLDNILESPKMSEEVKKDFIKNVYHQVENMNFLLIALLKLSRIEADVIVFKKEEIRALNLIEEVLKNVEVLREIKNVNIEIKGNKDVKFRGDYKWELEALTNIIKNAVEYSENDGIINILVEENPVYTKITIQDNGIGMNEKDLKNIFKRFYKGENSASDSMGIGLNLAKNIIEKDNGYVKVSSKKNKGTIFEIRYMK